MIYKWVDKDAALRRKEWIDKDAATAWVTRVSGCDDDAARRRIDDAIDDGRLPRGDDGRLLWSDLLRLWPPPPPKPKDAETAKADEHRRAVEKKAAEDAFGAPFWPADRVLSWLAWCDPGQIARPWRHGYYDHPSSLAASGRPPFLGDPRPTLLLALQRGELRAIDRAGRELPPERWARVLAYTLPDVDFRRDDVLRVWPHDDGTQPDAPTPEPEPEHEQPSEFVRHYIDDERAAGRILTQRGLEAAWSAAGHRGNRALLRAAFSRALGELGEAAPGPGRPKNSPK